MAYREITQDDKYDLIEFILKKIPEGGVPVERALYMMECIVDEQNTITTDPDTFTEDDTENFLTEGGEFRALYWYKQNIWAHRFIEKAIFDLKSIKDKEIIEVIQRGFFLSEKFLHGLTADFVMKKISWIDDGENEMERTEEDSLQVLVSEYGDVGGRSWHYIKEDMSEKAKEKLKEKIREKLWDDFVGGDTEWAREEAEEILDYMIDGTYYLKPYKKIDEYIQLGTLPSSREYLQNWITDTWEWSQYYLKHEIDEAISYETDKSGFYLQRKILISNKDQEELILMAYAEAHREIHEIIKDVFMSMR